MSRSMHSTGHCQHGITLIELTIAVALLVIVMGFAIGPLQALVARMRVTASVNDFVASLTTARTLAITGRTPVTLCSGASGSCGDATAWNQGARLFLDADGDGALDTDEVIKRHLEARSNISILSGAGSITFNQDGTASLDSGELRRSWVFCDPAQHAAPRQVSVQRIGNNQLYEPSSCALP